MEIIDERDIQHPRQGRAVLDRQLVVAVQGVAGQAAHLGAADFELQGAARILHEGGGSNDTGGMARGHGARIVEGARQGPGPRQGVAVLQRELGRGQGRIGKYQGGAAGGHRLQGRCRSRSTALRHHRHDAILQRGSQARRHHHLDRVRPGRQRRVAGEQNPLFQRFQTYRGTPALPVTSLLA